VATSDCGRILVDVDSDLRDLMPVYLANRENDIGTVTAALGRRDFELVGRIGHNMQGSGCSFGLDEVTAIGAAIEGAANAGDRAEIVNQLRRLEDYLSRIEVVSRGRKSAPAQAGPAAAANRAPDEDTGRMKSGRGEGEILLVDDQEMNTAVISRFLVRAGYRVRSCASGEAALAALEGSPLPALILLDVVMAGANGLEICRSIKSNPVTRGIPIALVTCIESSRDRIRGWAAGAEDVLPKPVRREELIGRVRLLLHAGRDAGDRMHGAQPDNQIGSTRDGLQDHGTAGLSAG